MQGVWAATLQVFLVVPTPPTDGHSEDQHVHWLNRVTGHVHALNQTLVMYSGAAGTLTWQKLVQFALVRPTLTQQPTRECGLAVGCGLTCCVLSLHHQPSLLFRTQVL